MILFLYTNVDDIDKYTQFASRCPHTVIQFLLVSKFTKTASLRGRTCSQVIWTQSARNAIHCVEHGMLILQKTLFSFSCLVQKPVDDLFILVS